MGEFVSGLLCCEHPIDAGGGGVALPFPGGDLADEVLAMGDAAVEALAS